eukprot:15857-Heterococcus_DN1.PRE.1
MTQSSPIPGDEHLLLLTAIITVGMQLAFFAVAATFKFDKVTDFAGTTNFVVLAIVTLVLWGTYHARQIVVAVFVIIWGLRLASYLLFRICITGTDERFDDKRDDFLKFLGFWIFQMVWVWLVSLPVTFLATTTVDPEFGTAADIAGIIMFIIGLVCEAVADQQKFSFKQNSANRGKWCDVGIWKYSRHPNYFGEILLWFGLFTIASSVFQPASDAGEETKADEKHGSKPEYREYKACTSVLIPFVP